jgi:hypothetical protein
MKDAINNVRRDFVANMDESGCADYVDTRKERVLVTVECDKATVSIPADRTEKRATIVAGVAADGASLKPMIVLGRKTIANELDMLGYTPDKYTLVHQEKGFITKKTIHRMDPTQVGGGPFSRRLRVRRYRRAGPAAPTSQDPGDLYPAPHLAHNPGP